MGDRIVHYHDLDVYKKGFEASTRIFEFSRQFPKEETSLADRPIPPIVSIGMREPCRGVAQATI